MTKIVTLRSFFNYLADGGLVATNPAADLVISDASASVSGSLPIIIRQRREPRVRTAIVYRNRALISLDTAIRVSFGDLARLDVGDVTFDAGGMELRLHGGRKVESVRSKEAWRDLGAYVFEGRPSLAHSEGDALFLNNRGQRMTRQGIWLVLGTSGIGRKRRGRSPRSDSRFSA